MTSRRLATVAVMLVAACAQLSQEPGQPPPTAPSPSAPVIAPPGAPSAGEPATRAPPKIQTGRVSFYAASFAGKKTASGEVFDPQALSMAHRSLPFGTHVRVTNLANQRSVEVVVNDRGPAIDGRIADLSPAAARAIGLTDGVVNARIEVLSLPGERGNDQ